MCVDGRETTLPPNSERSDSIKECVREFGEHSDQNIKRSFLQNVSSSSLEEGISQTESELNFSELILNIYNQNNFNLLFITAGELTPMGVTLTSELSQIGSWGLEPDKYHLELIQQKLTSIEGLKRFRAEAEFILHPDETAALIEWLSQDGSEVALCDTDWLLKQVLDQEITPLRPLAIRADQYKKSLEDEFRLNWQIEVLMADAFLALAYDLRDHNLSCVPEVTVAEKGQDAFIKERLSSSFVAFSEDVGELKNLYPPFPQIQKLHDTYLRYKEFCELGGWSSFSPRKVLRRGKKSPDVVLLKRRLASEGYWDGDEDEVFSNDLRKAVQHYQQTHQLNDNGRIDTGTLRSMNRSCELRLAQIKMTLKTWYDSNLCKKDHYVFVNLPDFHAEVWNNDKRVMRFKVIVGSTKRTYSKTEKRYEYRNATPIMVNQIKYVIYNPYWNVPRRIRRKELEPKLVENPLYYEENHYEIFVNENGREILRQVPGDHNALGVVKFSFPNDQKIFMHDTPKKHLFKKPVRAYSHGCIRVENPLDFAFYMLTNDRQWREEKTTEILESGEERWIKLKKPVPIYINYFTVRIDNDGFAHFLADIYKYNRPKLEAMGFTEQDINPRTK